ncbi:hypothetical protein BCR37DRAFT_383080 [Protomyces lactucae-debilis]|uniref:Uncharacterized protein n=1 Tax=Protomyces lactucae-debilis TaxID=2754530 RepID=A0A1Y2F022_PROLT|nr:uncharacterized protein BCR37DRAFT_383080 [Protomyces lactucae-debilis]ORY77057.1 hypothetical protein BCR37DRAFT_383080 [Protomyces lactucae-debilis]
MNWFTIQSLERKGGSYSCRLSKIENKAPPDYYEFLVAAHCHAKPSAGQSVLDLGGPPYAKLFWDFVKKKAIPFNWTTDELTGRHTIVYGSCDESD